MVLTHSDLRKKDMFYKCDHISGPKRSPDMILSAVNMKFHSYKNKIPTRACRLPKSQQKQKAWWVRGRGAERMGGKMVISLAPGRFPKSEFDSMLVNMVPQALHIPKGSKISKSWDLRGRGRPRAGQYTSPILFLKDLCIELPIVPLKECMNLAEPLYMECIPRNVSTVQPTSMIQFVAPKHALDRTFIYSVPTYTGPI